jgi:pyrimidine oxygenase
MGLWPGDAYFSRRYEYLSEYVQILRDLWETGVSNRKSEFFQMDDCRVSPRPEGDMKIICAGQSEAGMAFSAKYADYNFCLGKGINTPTAFAPAAAKLLEANAKTGRNVTSFALVMIIADETDEAAFRKWELYKAGADDEALAWLTQQAGVDKSSDTNVRQLADPTSAVNLNMGTLVGSYANVARMLDEIDTVPGAEGVLLTFDDFVQGVEAFGTRIQPLMASRRHLAMIQEAV